MPQGLPSTQFIQGDNNPPGNQFKAVLDSFLPTHTWIFDEVSGNYIDSGIGGNIAPLSDTLARAQWRRAPGVIRGLPREYGYWTTGAAFDVLGGPTLIRGATPSLDASAWITGTLGIAGVVFSFFDNAVFIDIAFDNSNNSHIRLMVLTTGQVRLICNFTGFQLIGTTDNPVIVQGVPFLIVATQAANGNGINIHINGVSVPVTNVVNGGVTIDSWADDIATLSVDPGICSDVAINRNEGIVTANTDMTFAIFQRPFIIVNGVVSAGQALSLYNASSIDGIAQDYWDVVQDLTGLGRWGFITGWIHDVGNDFRQMANGGIVNTPLGVDAAFFRSGGGGAGFTGNLVIDDKVISDYTYYRTEYPSTVGSTVNVSVASDFDSTVGVNDIKIPFDPTDTSGTLIFLLTLAAGITSLSTKPILTLNTQNASRLKITMANNAGVYTVTIRITNNAGNFYQEITADLGLNIGDFFVLGISQDGVSGGLNIYLDGVPVITTPSTAVLTANAWFAAMDGWDVTAAASELKLCGDNSFQFTAQGIWGANDFHGFIGATKALDASEHLTLFNSINGIY